GLVAGGAAFLIARGRPAEAQGDPRASGRRTLLCAVSGVAAVVMLVVALGATPIVGEVGRTDLTGRHEKIAIWKDSLAMIPAHPAGVGRHAYARVQSAYKTLPWNAQFEFVENAPLQLLIDCVWLGFALLAGSAVLLVRQT